MSDGLLNENQIVEAGRWLDVRCRQKMRAWKRRRVAARLAEVRRRTTTTAEWAVAK